jgi:AcrR family transcriptional regulator
MSKGADTRERILRAALAMACTEGLSALHLNPIATRAGLTKSGLYAHFGARETLQLATLDAAAARFRLAVVVPAKSAGAGLAQLEGIFARWLAWPANAGLAGRCPFLGAVATAASLAPPVQERLRRQLLGFHALIEPLVAAAARRGHLAPATQPGQFAHELLALRHGHQIAHDFLGDPEALARTRTAFRALVARGADAGIG